MAQPKVNILESAMMLVVVRRWPPQSRTVKNKGIIQTTAQAQMLSLNKKLWDSPQLRAIQNHEARLDDYLKHKSSPMPLRAGHHIVPNLLYNTVKARLEEHIEQRKPLIAAFKAAYQEALKKSKEILGDQFNITDYPTEEQIEGYFFFAWQMINFSVADKLIELDKEAAAQKCEELEKEIVQAAELQQHLLRVEMETFVTELVDKLSPKQDEKGELKRKTFRDSVLNKINEFKELFAARNLSQDGKLAELVQQTEQLLNGVSPDLLRSNDTLRQKVCDGFAEIKSNLSQIIVNEPVRAISFED
jgi:hypothetical protein